MSDIYNNKRGFDVPPAFIPTTEQLLQLSMGDEGITETLILSTVQYAVEEAEYFLVIVPAAKPFKEDLISEAMLVLTESVHTLWGGNKLEPGQFIAYIKKAVNHRLQEWLDENKITVSISSRSQRRHRLRIVQKTLKEYHKVLSVAELVGEIEFDDQLSELFTPEQRYIVLAKISGVTDDQLSTDLGCSRNTIRTKRKHIRDILGSHLE